MAETPRDTASAGHESITWYWEAGSEDCPHGPQPDYETDGEAWEAWRERHPSADCGPVCLDAPIGKACEACSEDAGEMVGWDLCRVREDADADPATDRAEAWDIPDARPGTTDHTLTTAPAAVAHPAVQQPQPHRRVAPPHPQGAATMTELSPASQKLLREIAKYDTGAGVLFLHVARRRYSHPNTLSVYNARTFYPLTGRGLVDDGGNDSAPVRVTETGRKLAAELEEQRPDKEA